MRRVGGNFEETWWSVGPLSEQWLESVWVLSCSWFPNTVDKGTAIQVAWFFVSILGFEKHQVLDNQRNRFLSCVNDLMPLDIAILLLYLCTIKPIKSMWIMTSMKSIVGILAVLTALVSCSQMTECAMETKPVPPVTKAKEKIWSCGLEQMPSFPGGRRHCWNIWQRMCVIQTIVRTRVCKGVSSSPLSQIGC